jgi:hypothetical protein
MFPIRYGNDWPGAQDWGTEGAVDLLDTNFVTALSYSMVDVNLVGKD